MYQADNSRFAEKVFQDKVANYNQVITYFGVRAYH